MAEKPGQAKIRPRIGRWENTEGGRVRLVASRCSACGEMVFPERSACPRCRGEAMEEVRLEGPAKLHSFTTVYQLPSGFPSPMLVGYGLFPEGLLVFAPIDADPKQLRPGLLLEMHEGVTRVDEDGEAMPSYRFRPAAG